MKSILSAILLTGLFGVTGSRAEACGFKVLTIRRPPRHTDIQKARLPKATSEPRPVVAAKSKPQPVSAGPTRQEEERELVAAKTPEPAPAAAAEPAPAPAPAASPVDEEKEESGEAASSAQAPKSEFQFKSNSAGLTQQAKKRIRTTATWLKGHAGASVVVEGHSDASGPSEYNRELSQRRAEAVRDALVEAGVDGSSIEVVGLGEDRPAYKSAAKNRRAAILVKETGAVSKDDKNR